MIAFENVRFRALSVPSLALPPGVTTIIGPNGAGKSTFLKLCAGIREPEQGTISVEGLTPRNTETGYVNEFPDRNLLFSTVKDELATPLRFRHVPCAETEREVRACAEMWGIAGLLDRAVKDLSGGEKCLVALATACITRPRVLVLDEYDSHLDAGRCAAAERVLRSSGATYIIRCTQQMETAAESDLLIFLEKGRIPHAGEPAAVFSRLAGSSFYPLSWRCRS
jgi:energy-coupling factor transport system ATP-binding protein